MFAFFKERKRRKRIENDLFRVQGYIRQIYVPEENADSQAQNSAVVSSFRPADAQIRYSLKESIAETHDLQESQIRYSAKDPDIESETGSAQIRFNLRGESEVVSRPDQSQIRYSVKDEPETPTQREKAHILYSERDGRSYSSSKSTDRDFYDAKAVNRAMRDYSVLNDSVNVMQALQQNMNQSFSDRLLHYISIKGMRDSQVYKAAQVDKRLFSKIVTNREYKPSKDTVLAFAFALHLTLDEANDLLARAGYTLSHSSKRDIIIEYFFREQGRDLMDVNDVLYRLDQKLIGRQ